MEGCADKPSVSVLIAARNEAGNIAQIFERVAMGSSTELIFVEGHSKDNTYDVIEDIAAQSNRRCNTCGKREQVRVMLFA